MGKTVTVKISGLKEIDDALLTMATKDARKATRTVLKEAGAWMAAQIAAVAPRRSGFLATNIVSKVSISAKQDQATVSVGPSRDAYYAQFDEFGSVHNTPPQPFIRRTFEQSGEAWLNRVVSGLKSALGL
jgi:HK97 gp10 family phage protein